MRDSSTRSDGARQRQSRGRALAAVAILAALAAGCSDDETTADLPTSAGQPTTTTPVAAPSTSMPSDPGGPSGTSDTTVADSSESSVSPDGSVEDEIVAAYVAFWDARFEANTGTPNPDSPGLRATATGEQLGAVVGETQANLDGGLAFKARPNPAGFRKVTVISVSGDAATVQECVVDDGLVVRRDSGAVVNDTVETHNARGELVREQGAWRVARVELVQRWDGVNGCAADS